MIHQAASYGLRRAQTGCRYSPKGAKKCAVYRSGRFPGLALAFLLLLICAGGLFAQEGGELLHLSPQDAVNLAVKNNLSLENARLTLDTKKRKSDLVWNQFLPTLTATGTLMRDNWASTTQGINIPGVITTPPSTLPQWHVNGTFQATLDFTFALVEGIRSIKLDYQTGLVTLEKARLQMERDVRKMYNQFLLLKENALLLGESYKNAERQAASAEANYRAGMVPRLSWLQAQVQVENMKPSINENENNLKSLQGNFAMSLGLPIDTRFELEALNDGDFYIPLDTVELISRAA
jgi:outer membrane protein TolC